MRVGPLDLPVANVNQLVTLALLVVLIVFAARRVPFIPAQFRP